MLTLIAYAITAQLRGQDSLDPTKAFTSIAIMTLVTTPANILLGTIAGFASALAGATRIQTYLLEPSREDKRTLLDSPLEAAESPAGNDAAARHGVPAVVIDNMSVRPAASANICLEGINLRLSRGSFNVICGAVGTGKTTLARAILGDVPPDTGAVFVSTKRIGYCAQRPWLINASIKANICGPSGRSSFDDAWYRTVVHACGLDEDLMQLSFREFEAVGSRGATLSGGQRQRVVLLSLAVFFVEIGANSTPPGFSSNCICKTRYRHS